MSQYAKNTEVPAGRSIPTDAVNVAGTRFTPGPHEYVIRPPFGDGQTRYPTREEAMSKARETNP